MPFRSSSMHKIFKKKKHLKLKKPQPAVVIDCTKPAEDKILDASTLEAFLKERMKHPPHTEIIVQRIQHKISVNSDAPFSKRYLKYLTKKYLKKHGLREWLRVVASGHHSYELRYFNIPLDEEEEENNS